MQDPERAAQLNNDFPGFYSPQRTSEPARPLNGDLLPGILPGELPTPVQLIYRHRSLVLGVTCLQVF